MKEGFGPSIKDIVRGAAVAGAVLYVGGCAKESTSSHATWEASKTATSTAPDYTSLITPIVNTSTPNSESTPTSEIPTVDPTPTDEPYPSKTPELPEDPLIKERFALPEFIQGFSVLQYGNEVYNGNFSEASNQWLDRLQKLGVNSASFVFPIYQDNYRSNSVHPGDGTPTLDNMRRFIRSAKFHGMSVMLRPILDEGSIVADGRWRGSIEPDNRDAWFESYKSLIVDYAKMAESEYVEVLDIGSELVSLEGESDKWKDVIKSVREVFKGKITYSFNHDSFDNSNSTAGSDYIKDLDFIGMDAYYPLDLGKGASPEQVSAAFQYAFDRMSSLKKTYGVPVLIAEMGTIGHQFDRPWAWDGSGNNAQDIKDQAAYYAGFCMDRDRMKQSLSGVYFWTAYLGEDPGKIDPNTPSFAPFNKPAETELDKCYS